MVGSKQSAQVFSVVCSTAIDTFMKSQIKSVRVGNAPLGVSANPERQEVYVANSGSNSISVIDSITDEEAEGMKKKLIDYKKRFDKDFERRNKILFSTSKN